MELFIDEGFFDFICDKMPMIKHIFKAQKCDQKKNSTARTDLMHLDLH